MCHFHTNDKKSKIAKVQVLGFFLVSVVISQYRGPELLASLQGMWLGALCPGGETGNRETFPGIKEV